MEENSTSLLTFEDGIPDCPLIEISGSPRDRGRQYGEAAADRIALGIGHYTAQLHRNDLDDGAIKAITEQFAEGLQADFGTQLDEMRGIAEGADVPFSSIMLLNARTEILKIARRRKAGLSDFIEPDGCTGVIVEPEATRDGRLIHAQDWDWKTECAETSVVLRILRDDGPDVLTFTEAGGLARAGMNSAGVSITGNYLESNLDYSQPGVPLAIVRRKALEQEIFANAIRLVHATPKSASNNMMLAHSAGMALNFECVPNETFTLPAQDGLIVHANHFQSQAALSRITDRGIANMPDSLYRDLRVQRLLAPKLGQITVDDVKDALFDDLLTPFSVCRPPRLSMSNNQSATVAMIVMEPETGLMQVSILPALNRTFRQYSIDPEKQAASPG